MFFFTKNDYSCFNTILKPFYCNLTKNRANTINNSVAQCDRTYDSLNCSISFIQNEISSLSAATEFDEIVGALNDLKWVKTDCKRL